MPLRSAFEAAFFDELFREDLLLEPLAGGKARQPLSVTGAARLIHARIHARGVCAQSLFHSVRAL